MSPGGRLNALLSALFMAACTTDFRADQDEYDHLRCAANGNCGGSAADAAPGAGGVHDGSAAGGAGATGGGGGGGRPGVDDDGSTSGAGGGVVDGPDGDEQCTETSYTLAPAPASVVLLLDKSGSMVSNTWDHDGSASTPEVTRWSSLYRAVESVVTDLDQTINFGATLFPSISATATLNAQACVVETLPEVLVASNNAQAIMAAIPPVNAQVAGATPTTAGFRTAVEHLKTLAPSTPRFVVLVTDGAPNCSATAMTNFEFTENLDAALAGAVSDANTLEGIATLVVGIDIVDAVVGTGTDGTPEANVYAVLNSVADAGGRPRSGVEHFYNTRNENELRTTLDAVASQTLDCTVPLNAEPPYPTLLQVSISDVALQSIVDCSVENGWRYTAAAIELCGTACSEFRRIRAVDVVYGCP